MIKIYIILSISFISHTCSKQNLCDQGHNGIEFVNSSNRKIVFEFYWNYPDTSIGAYNPVEAGTLKHNESIKRGAGRNSCWEEVFAEGRKQWIYIFDQDTINKLDWNIVRQTNRGLLERRLIDLNYLQEQDFKIIY